MSKNSASRQTMRKAVVLCVDQGYLPYALFLANQLHQKEQNRDYDICFVSDTVLNVPKQFEDLRLVISGPVTDVNYGALKTTHLARSTYLRMWAPELLARQYDRIIYMDSDMFVDAAGLSRLFEVDLRGRPLAAVLDVQQWYRPRRDVKEFVLAGRRLRRYFNGGFLLIDTKHYNSYGVLDKAVQLARDHPEWVLHHDQSLLNLVLDGTWTELSPVWNWQWAWKYPLFTDWAGPRILHFIGVNKPWNDTLGYCPKRFHMAYNDFFATHFPDLPLLPQSLDVLRSPRRMTRLALRFVALRGRLLRYLEQFSDAYSTK